MISFCEMCKFFISFFVFSSLMLYYFANSFIAAIYVSELFC